jgi:UDP-GlcNAc:undecaprenyl-phosphate GlcNAc-1-phosphate transferase
MTILLFIVPAVLAGLIAFALTPVARALAFRVHAIDQPEPRKIHVVPTARLGGLAVIVSVSVVLAAMVIFTPRRIHILPADLLLPIAIGVVPILIVSLIDDIHPLRPLPKFIVHLIGTSATVALGVRLGEVVHLFGHEVRIGWMAVPISILWLAGTTNAFNIVDGLDGLSAGLALISAVSLAAVSVVNTRYEMAGAALVLAGALCGFLPHNIYPARIYLGDTGATVIGFFLGALTLRGGSTATAGLAVMIPVLVLGVPIAETLLSMTRRFARRLQGGKKGILDADRDHIHHRLLALGYTPKRAVLLMYGIGVLVALCGLASVFMNEKNAGLMIATLSVGALVGVAKLGYDEFALIRSGAVLRVYNQPVLRSGLFIVFIDLGLIVLAIYTAIVLKYDDWSVRDHRQLAIGLIALAPAATVATFALMGTYRQQWSKASVEDFLRSSIAVLLSVAAVVLINAFMIPTRTPLTFFALYGLLALSLVNGSRASYRVLHHWNQRSNREGEPVVIYGAGKSGILALREILTNSEVLMRPIGFIDDDPAMHGRTVNGYSVLGDFTSLRDVVADGKAKGVVIASEKIPMARIRAARELCASSGMWLRYFEVNFRPDLRSAP